MIPVMYLLLQDETRRERSEIISLFKCLLIERGIIGACLASVSFPVSSRLQEQCFPPLPPPPSPSPPLLPLPTDPLLCTSLTTFWSVLGQTTLQSFFSVNFYKPSKWNYLWWKLRGVIKIFIWTRHWYNLLYCHWACLQQMVWPRHTHFISMTLCKSNIIRSDIMMNKGIKTSLMVETWDSCRLLHELSVSCCLLCKWAVL